MMPKSILVSIKPHVVAITSQGKSKDLLISQARIRHEFQVMACLESNSRPIKLHRKGLHPFHVRCVLERENLFHLFHELLGYGTGRRQMSVFKLFDRFNLNTRM
jgi:hypothetical protein